MNESTEKREFLTVDEFGAPVDRRIADPSVMRLIFANFKAEGFVEAETALLRHMNETGAVFMMADDTARGRRPAAETGG